MAVVGIDFGNLYSKVALTRRGGIDVVANETSNRITPSMVSFDGKERALGEPALNLFVRNNKNTISQIKRLIGRKFHELDVQEDIKKGLYPFNLVELEDGGVGVTVRYNDEQHTFSMVQVLGMLFQKLKFTAELEAQAKVADVVVSVPSFFTAAQRRAILEAGEVAGMRINRLLNETTATALNHGFYKTDFSETEPTYVAFVDVGHAHTQASVVAFKKDKLTVVAHAWDRNTGARDLDEALTTHFAAEFKKNHGIDVYTNKKALLRLRQAIEKVRKVLSANPETSLNVECLMNDVDVRGMITREEMESFCPEVFQKVQRVCADVIEKSGIPKEKLSSVEVVGSATITPAIVTCIEEVFGHKASTTMNRSEAVARGCALHSAMLSALFKVRDFEVNDLVSYPVSLSWKNLGDMEVEGTDSKANASEVFPSDCKYPSTKLMTFYRSQPFQLSLFYSNPQNLPQGADEDLGTFKVTEVTPASTGEPAKVKVRVKMDVHGIVVVDHAQSVEEIEVLEKIPKKKEEKKEEKKVEDEKKQEEPMEQESKEEQKGEDKKEEVEFEEKLVKKKAKVDLPVVESTSALSRKQLDELIEKEAEMALQDRILHETLERKNDVESYIYSMRDRVYSNLSEFVSESVRSEFVKQLETAEDWLYGEGEDVEKSKYVSKLNELKAIGEPIVRRSVEADERPPTVKRFRDTIAELKAEAESQDEKYAHIPPDERERVLSAAAEAEAWLNKGLADIEGKAKYEDPSITCKDIDNKILNLRLFCRPILDKPKPKPKPEPSTEKKEEEKPSEEEKSSEQQKEKEEPMETD